MQRKHFGNMQCPIARSLERVGEWWSILILRDAFYGLSHFDEFQKSLNIAPNMLTRRLQTLVAEGMLERQLYCSKPPRYAYVLTPRARDFRPVLLTLMAWGNQHFAPEGASVILRDVATGHQVEPILTDAVSGQRITPQQHVVSAGPAAATPMRRRIARTGSK